jgi:3'-5' exoribonuclease
VVLGRDLLRERCAAIPDFPDDLRLLLEHLVLSHQGKKEFSSPVEPMTPEAVALHFIDDLDAKLNQLRIARESSPGMLYHRGLARYVYLPAPEGPPLNGAEPPEPAAALPEQPGLFGDLPAGDPRGGSDAGAERAGSETRAGTGTEVEAAAIEGAATGRN